jgi:N-acetylmuramoyl-L-alanine amidase
MKPKNNKEMRLFTSNNEAKKVAEQIAKTTQVFFTNEGLEILFTSEDKNQKEVANELKSVFTDVKVKGRKVKSIVINRINQVTNGLRITEVAY